MEGARLGSAHAAAPSTTLRAVPLPRYAGEDRRFDAYQSIRRPSRWKSRTRLARNRARLPEAGLISPEIGPARRPSTAAPSGSPVPDRGAMAKRTRRRRWVGRIWRRVLDLADQSETAWPPKPSLETGRTRAAPRAPESSSANGPRHAAPPHDANALGRAKRHARRPLLSLASGRRTRLAA